MRPLKKYDICLRTENVKKLKKNPFFCLTRGSFRTVLFKWKYFQGIIFLRENCFENFFGSILSSDLFLFGKFHFYVCCSFEAVTVVIFGMFFLVIILLLLYERIKLRYLTPLAKFFLNCIKTLTQCFYCRKSSSDYTRNM